MTTPREPVHELVPRRSVGPIQFGMEVPVPPPFKDGVEQQVGPIGLPLLVSPSLGLRIERDTSGRVHEVEVIAPGQLAWSGITFLGRTLRQVVLDLRAAGIRVRTHRGSEAESDDLALRLWTDDGVVTGATAFDPDDPMPVPTTEEILRSLGIAPLSEDPRHPDPDLWRRNGTGSKT